MPQLGKQIFVFRYKGQTVPGFFPFVGLLAALQLGALFARHLDGRIDQIANDLMAGRGDPHRLAASHKLLGLASSSNRPVIDAVLQRAGIADCFAVTVSGDEVAAGKPAPDVYLTATRRLGVDAANAAAVEDSTNSNVAKSSQFWIIHY